MEYKHEIGIYKSLGISNRSIKSIFYKENLIIVLKAIVIAVTFIDLMSFLLNNVIYDYTGLNNIILLNKSIIIIMLFISVVLSILSTI